MSAAGGRRSRIQPVGLSAGTMGLVLAWLGGAAIGRLTGATAVVILLAVGTVAALAAAAESLIAIRAIEVGDVAIAGLAVQGDPVPVEVEVAAPRSVWVELMVGSDVVASGWSDDRLGRWSGSAVFSRRGLVGDIAVVVRSGGSLGLWWWQRRHRVEVAPVAVAAALSDHDVPTDRRSLGGDGDVGGPAGAIAGEIDGIRPWRDGDSERWVHWSSSMRSGELMVHDRRRPSESELVVRPRADTDDPDAEAGAARRAIERGLRSGSVVRVQVGDGEPTVVADAEAAARWSAAVDLGHVAVPTKRWWQRSWTAEPDSPASVWARRWSALATFIALTMLSEALGLSRLVILPIGITVVLAAAVSGRSLVTGRPPSPLVRALVGVAALVGLGMVVASSGRLDGLLPFLRGPLPQVLIILILIHGFECRDRRTVRVGVGISAVVIMYASAFRVDDQLVWWLLAWTFAVTASLVLLARPRPERTGGPTWTGSWVHRTKYLGATAAVSVVVLAIVPVPDGPARLTLPTIVDERAVDVDQPGAIAGPDGEISDREVSSEPGTDRAPVGQLGGYTGFAESMDTSVRGSLSDDVVMRVRAPSADFWRGQTFSEFDGRRWYADQEQGLLERGPNIDVPLTFGDPPQSSAVEYDELIQTYYLETDMPNLVFHAYRPSTIVIDSNVWIRGDGALRASTTLPEGSVYTVVSNRPRVDAAVLRRQGHVNLRLTDRGRDAFARQLAVPSSTSPETIALAAELAEGAASTYDVVRAYETWMNANVEYDLDAPLPELGEDAVHDFLFDSRLGFCEQIASSLTVMLRTQGIPARLAAGYTSGTRDSVTGVFEVKASDAHAWVEVWFPETGWQAFDPTAAVPLSSNSDVGSVGGGLLTSGIEFVAANLLRLALVLGAVAAALLAIRSVLVIRHRRQRGRWGLLQDRFVERAVGHGARPGAPNIELAAAWGAADDAEYASAIAAHLDRAAFAPDFDDDDGDYAEARRLVDALPAEPRRR